MIETPKPMMSEAKCAASAMIAIEPAHQPPTSSAAINTSETQLAQMSFFIALRCSSYYSLRREAKFTGVLTGIGVPNLSYCFLSMALFSSVRGLVSSSIIVLARY